MNPQLLRRRVGLALSCALLLLPLLGAGWYVAHKHAWARERLEQLAPRYARLLGLEAQRSDLQAARQRATGAYAQYVYPPAADEAQTGNQLQQKVRDIFSAAGLQTISSQVLPAKQDQGFDRVTLAVRTEGEIIGVQSALAVLGNQQPLIMIDELTIQVLGGLNNLNPKFAPKLSAQFTLSVLRERP